MKRLFFSDKSKTQILLRIVLALAGNYGLSYLGGLMGVQVAAFSVMGLLLTVALCGLLAWTEKNLGEAADGRRRCLYAGIVSFLFSVSMIMGYQLQMRGMTECGVKGKGLIILRALCLSIAVFPFGNLLFCRLERLKNYAGQRITTRKEWKPAAVFAICAVIIFACLIPVWLAYYPIIMSYDFHRQINEAAKGFIWFYEYQPLAHTWIIWLFLQLGYALNDLPAGMAGMALFQMLVYSLVTAYAGVFLYRILKKRWAVVGAVLFFGIFPLNSVLVVCTTKDVLFSILFLLFVLMMAEYFFFRRGKKRIVWEVLMVLEGCVMMQFRNNAIYAMAVFGVLWLIFAAKKEKLRAFLLVLLLVAGGKGMAVGVKAALGTKIPGAKIEMYSVPIQQFARVGFYHGAELDQETWQLLNSYVQAEVWQDYNAPIADTIKGGGGVAFEDMWDGHEMQLLADWVKIGLRFPNEYIDAFLELTRGYWFWDDRSYAECLGYGIEGRMGIVYTYYSSEIAEVGEIEHQSKFPWLEEQLEKVVSGNYFYQWPVISVLFKCAFYFWGLCLVFLAFLFLRKKKQAVLCLFPLTYVGTMLLGPVVQMRYMFPIMLTLPVLASLLFLQDRPEPCLDKIGNIPE